MTCHHNHGDPACSCDEEFDSAFDSWFSGLTEAERLDYADALNIEFAEDGSFDEAEFEQAMADLYSDHLDLHGMDPDADVYPPVPRRIVSKATADYFNGRTQAPAIIEQALSAFAPRKSA